MNDLLTKLKTAATAADRKAAGDYAAAVGAAAEGRDADPADLLAVITRAGRTPEDFAADVEPLKAEYAAARLADRQRLAELVAARPEIDRRRQEIAVAREQAAADYHTTIAGLNAADQMAFAELLAADDARRELVRTAAPELVERADAARTAADDAHQRLPGLKEGERDARYRAGAMRRRLDSMMGPERADRLAVEAAERRAAELKQKLADAEADAERRKADADAAAAALLVP